MLAYNEYNEQWIKRIWLLLDMSKSIYAKDTYDINSIIVYSFLIKVMLIFNNSLYLNRYHENFKVIIKMNRLKWRRTYQQKIFEVKQSFSLSANCKHIWMTKKWLNIYLLLLLAQVIAIKYVIYQFHFLWQLHVMIEYHSNLSWFITSSFQQ